MNVLYLHAAGAFSGSSKSLVELFCSLQAIGVVKGVVLTPAGASSVAFAKAGMDVRIVKGFSQFDNTRYSYYQHLRWLILLRELFLLPFSVLALWRLRHEHFDLLHVNEITLLPLGILAKHLLGIPMVIHIRSLQRKPGTGWRTQKINRWLRDQVETVVAIDHTVAATLEQDLPLHIVHNGLKVDVAVPLHNHNARVRVGFLGTLSPFKGIYELVEAMRILKERGVSIECIIAGENVRELSGIKAWLLRKLGVARNVRAELEVMIVRYGLQQHVRLLGFVGDVHTLYPQIDILCFPSHLDAAGRPVFEAAFYGIPSIVAVNNPLPDAVLHGETGLAIPRPEPLLIANALQQLTGDAVYRQALGARARVWANEHFSIERNAALIYAIYQQTIAQGRKG